MWWNATVPWHFTHCDAGINMGWYKYPQSHICACLAKAELSRDFQTAKWGLHCIHVCSTTMNNLPESISHTLSVGEKKKRWQTWFNAVFVPSLLQSRVISWCFPKRKTSQDLSKIDGEVGSGEKQTDGLTLQWINSPGFLTSSLTGSKDLRRNLSQIRALPLRAEAERQEERERVSGVKREDAESFYHLSGHVS